MRVTDDENGAADAHVQVDAGSHKYFGTTDADGIAELKIPQTEDVFLLSAWTDDHKLGGLHAARKPTRDQFGTDFHVEVNHYNPVRARVVDARQQPVANIPLNFVAVAGKH